MLRQLGQRCRVSALFQIVGRRAQDTGALRNFPGDQMWLLNRADTDVDVERFARQVHPAVNQFEPYIQIRMLPPQLSQDGRNVHGAKPVTGAYLERPPQRPPRLRHFLVQCIGRLQYLDCPRVHLLALRCDAHPAGSAQEKPDCQRLFKTRDALGHIGNRNPQVRGGSSETGAAGDSTQDA